MYKNDDFKEYTPEKMVHYIRTKHKKFEKELPEHLVQWLENQQRKVKGLKLNNGIPLNLSEEQKTDFKEIIKTSPGIEVYETNNNPLKLEIATKIVCSLNSGLASAESLVDHAWEIAELLIKKSEER